MDKLNRKQIEDLLPQRAYAFNRWTLWYQRINFCHSILNVKDSFFVNGHFPGQHAWCFNCESFGQAAAALTAHGLDKSTYENKLVFLMSVEKARFRNPVVPDCKLVLKIEAVRSWKSVEIQRWCFCKWRKNGWCYVVSNDCW